MSPKPASQNLDDILAESSSYLQSLLGLRPTAFPKPSNSVRTFQCGDMKFPDVSNLLDCVMGSPAAETKSSSKMRRMNSEASLKNPLARTDPPVTRSRTVSASGILESMDSPTTSTTSFSFSCAINIDNNNVVYPRHGRSISPESSASYSSSPTSQFCCDPMDQSTMSISDLDPAVTQAVIDLKSLHTTSDDLNNNCGVVDHQNNLLNLFETHDSMSHPEMHSSFHPEGAVRAASLLADRRQINSMFSTNPEDPTSLDRAARLYRNAAAIFDATCTWSGKLPPPRSNSIPLYSCKVFLGGIPWDITENNLMHAFRQFGPVQMEWPVKNNSSVSARPKGYVYVIFQQEKNVKALLSQCMRSYSNGGSWYYKISSRRLVSKEVQVIPWPVSDSNFVRCPSQQLDPRMTVFVGALHGMLNAEGLAHIFNDLFDGVVYAGIDTDRHRYPIGSGRVTFNNKKSYMKAVTAAFIEIKSHRFVKKVQVDPYLENALCGSCSLRQGPYFCRDVRCFQYFCRDCWDLKHSSHLFMHHKPLMRSSRAIGVLTPKQVFFIGNGRGTQAFQME